MLSDHGVCRGALAVGLGHDPAVLKVKFGHEVKSYVVDAVYVRSKQFLASGSLDC